MLELEVHIPFNHQGNLAAAYNYSLQSGTSPWILFLDHDVFLANPLWYEICLNTIGSLREYDPKAGCVGCVCGGEHHKRTIIENGLPSDSIEYHIRESRKRFAEHGVELKQIQKHAAGYFLLLNRKIAQEIGFRQVNKGINNIDKDFGRRLLEAGYHIYNLPGLYIYHRRGMKHLISSFINASDI